MRIRQLDTFLLSIPFEDGGAGRGIMPSVWNTLDFCLVRLTDDRGLCGWGEGFGYYCTEATARVIERSIRPQIIDREISDIPSFHADLQRKMVLQGRYGISTFALSAVDTALWDLAAKREGVALAALLGGRQRDSLPAYASLVRYGDAGIVAAKSAAAAEEGYPEIKLHEITMPEIRAARTAAGDIPLSIDVNCNWSAAFAADAIPELIELHASWLEEPVFPPEDFRVLAGLRGRGLPIAAGENACTTFQFGEMCRQGAVDLVQPSVSKCGGITVFREVVDLVRENDLRLMPHNPYFGPGYLASLQLAAAYPEFELFEFLYIDAERWPYADMPLPDQGAVAIPDGPGLGLDPDPVVLEQFRVD